ncbi:MAG TPA: hypothetical protein ENH55_11995 [Aurantimonas coralicida]|uniref:Uncharacterized protein n=3 Tax=root TaxID=1 RepID=A0A9C9NH63_9HYPH|nr:hypothetical protein [Aurantimonas coralicida]HEU01406.1 hypothetical protein [Aurantimonas coralicida]
MALDIEVGETRRFLLDCAMYGVNAEKHEALLRLLKGDPVVGRQRPGSPSLWDWEFSGNRITYALSDDCSRLVLLRLTPAEAPKASRLLQIMKLIRTINEIKRLFGL